jgi:hypothetical protein
MGAMMESRWYTDVELRGTWSRTNTTRCEVTHYRRQMREAARLREASFDAICFREPLSEDGRTVGGTFVFRVRLMKANGSLKQAEALLKALSFATMCRPPKIKVDPLKSKTIGRGASYGATETVTW